MKHASSNPPLPSPLQVLLAPHQVVNQPARDQQEKHLPDFSSLATQVLHYLSYQHAWSGLRVHTRSPVTGEALERPLVSGVPERRLYVHPDEQVELLKVAEKRRRGKS